MVQVKVAKNIVIWMFLKFCFHIHACNQILLNLPMDDSHFVYITKLTKKTLAMDIIKYIIAKVFFVTSPKEVVGCLGGVKILLKGIA
jgi:hypothetical protein